MTTPGKTRTWQSVNFLKVWVIVDRLRGNTLIAISPPRNPAFCGRRQEFLMGKAPMRKVTRYVTPLALKWKAAESIISHVHRTWLIIPFMPLDPGYGSVAPFHWSVRKGEAGRPSLFDKLGVASLRHPNRTATGLAASSLWTTIESSAIVATAGTKF
jgi:hypothetical protein